MTPIELSKQVTAVLGAVSAFAYATGYLSLRTRSFVLGTEPAHALVDQAYLFAGFKLVLVSLLLFLVVSPLLWVLFQVGRYWQRLPLRAIVVAGEVMLIACLIPLSLLPLLALTGQGLLLDQDGATLFQQSYFETLLDTRVRLALSLVVVGVTALTALWLARSWTRESAHRYILGALFGLQLCLLPICNGALYADRYVRLLVEPPSGLEHIGSPVGVVDRTNTEVTLAAKIDDRCVLLNVPREALLTVPISGIVELSRFRQLLNCTTPSKMARPDASSNPAASDDDLAPAPLEAAEVGEVLADLDLVLTWIGALGGNPDSGELWLARIDPDGSVTDRRRVGTLEDVSWPVSDPSTGGFFVLRAGKLTQLDEEGGVLGTQSGDAQWLRLIGVDDEGRVLGIVLANGVERVALFDTKGQLRLMDHTGEASSDRMRDVMLQEGRDYAAGRKLRVVRSDQDRRGFDVVLLMDGGRINISSCGPDICGQPAFASDFTRVLYVKKPRF